LGCFNCNGGTVMRMNAGLPLILYAQGKACGILTNEADRFNLLVTQID